MNVPALPKVESGDLVNGDSPLAKAASAIIPTAADFGVLPTNIDNSAAIQNMVRELFAAGKRFVQFQPGVYEAPGLQAGVSNVLFIGDNATLKSPSCKRIVPFLAPPYVPTSDIVPSFHLQRLQIPGPKKVAIIGDSWAGYAGAQSRLDAGAGFIERAIKRAFPDKPIAVFPFGVGGASWGQWDTSFTGAGRSPQDARYDYWLGTDYSVPLLDPIEAWVPDVVIIQLGMNDGGRFSIASMRSVLGKIKAWSPRPDIVISNSPPPSSSYTDATNFRSFSSPTVQAGSDLVAGFMRTSAQVNGYGLLDLHRAFRAARDGFDCGAYMLQSNKNCGPLTFTTPFTVPLSSADFAMRIGITTSPATEAFAGGNALQIQIGNKADNLLSLSLDNSTGGLLATIDSASGHNFLPPTLVRPYLRESGTWTQEPFIVPKNGGMNFNIAVCGNYVGVEFNGGGTWGTHFEKYGGHFSPRVWMKDGAPQVIRLISSSYGVARPHMPVMTDAEAYGVHDGSGAYRGGGFNHLSSYGWHRVVQPVIEASCWRA